MVAYVHGAYRVFHSAIFRRIEGGLKNYNKRETETKKRGRQRDKQ